MPSARGEASTFPTFAPWMPSRRLLWARPRGTDLYLYRYCLRCLRCLIEGLLPTIIPSSVPLLKCIIEGAETLLSTQLAGLFARSCPRSDLAHFAQSVNDEYKNLGRSLRKDFCYEIDFQNEQHRPMLCVDSVATSNERVTGITTRARSLHHKGSRVSCLVTRECLNFLLRPQLSHVVVPTYRSASPSSYEYYAFIPIFVPWPQPGLDPRRLMRVHSIGPLSCLLSSLRSP